jgi:phosphoribosylanthranilate isomerase
MKILPRLKFCGFTRRDDVVAAIDAGADAIGLNFYPASKRFVTLQVGEELSKCAEGQSLRVGVFVNATPTEVESVVRRCGLDIIQLHGDEDALWLQEASKLSGLNGIGVLRALPYRGEVDDPAIRLWSSLALTRSSPVLGILVDAYDPIDRGGTGRTVRWDALYPRPRSFDGRMEDSLEATQEASTCAPCMLAGGIRVDNVVEALATARPDGIDLASGIESAPGIKDHLWMRRIAEQVQRYFDQVDRSTGE